MAEYPQFYAVGLSTDNGSWQAFQDDWKAQCDEVGEPFDDYAPDVTEILRRIAAGETEQTSLTKSSVCGVREGEDGRFWAAALVNWVYQLPGTNAPTVRVRHLTVSPRLDFGAEETEKYAHVLIGALDSVLTVTTEVYAARQLRFHLRSPADVNFFAAIGNALAGMPKFEKVETRGAWLYITLAEGDGGSDTDAKD